MKRILAIIVPIFGMSPAVAADLVPWGSAGDWEILIDPAVGNGCLAQKAFEDGTVVQIGANPARKGGFLAAYNAAWTDIEEGATGSVTMEFPEAAFAGEVVGVMSNGLPGGYAFFDNPNFTDEFTRRTSVVVTGESGRSIEIDLGGTTKAVESVRTCQAEQPE
ncbi:MAG: hypothetical protein GY798_31375 [Hyphomicrobiales bacterium]|nr:hypothetical protein [Hyphomicrobiales bacterium]